jgi:hypothetical protein
MRDRSLGESFEALGEWSVPDCPDRKVAGNLRYTRGEIVLELLDPFIPIRSVGILEADFQEYPIIHGTTDSGEAITLISAQRIGSSFSYGSGGARQIERLSASFLVTGGRLPLDFCFPEIRFRIPGLLPWSCRRLIESSNEEADGPGANRVVIRISQPPVEVVRVPGIEAELRWGVSLAIETDPYTAASAATAAWLGIRPDTPKPLNWFFEEQGRVGSLLTFLAGVAMPPDCVEAILDSDRHAASVLFDSTYPPCCAFKEVRRFFIPQDSMKAEFSDVLLRWLDLPASLGTPCHLAANVLSQRQQWVNLEFLALMQALEGLHRALCPGTYADPAAYADVEQALVAAIPEGVGADHREALRARIRYGNEYSLAKRLADLAHRLPSTARTLIIAQDGRVPRRWVDTRNYYTNWDESLGDKILDAEEMVYANLRMRHFLRALYLDLVGVPWEAIEAALRNDCRESRFLAQARAREGGVTAR